jgi:cell division protein FtsW
MSEHANEDRVLLVITLILLGIGIAMVYSASAVIALKKFDDPHFFLKKQILWAVLGGLGLYAAFRIDYHRLQPWALPILAVSLVLLLLVFLPPLGREIHGTRRWIQFAGLSFQPAELAKLALILYTASMLVKKGERIADFVYGFFPHVVLLGIFFFLIVLQPDLGSAVVLALLVLTLLFLGGSRPAHLLSLGVFLVPFLYQLISGVGYRWKRVLAFIDPWQDPTGAGFQIIQSFLALGSGGLLGSGPGEGKQKLFFLPEPHTDFIFALIGEEWGLIGGLVVIGLFLVILWRGTRIALRAPDPFGAYLAAGLTLMIALQALGNLAVVVGLVPTKGLPLPFVSFGGSALWVNLVGIGILLNVSRQSVGQASLSADRQARLPRFYRGLPKGGYRAPPY